MFFYLDTFIIILDIKKCISNNTHKCCQVTFIKNKQGASAQMNFAVLLAFCSCCEYSQDFNSMLVSAILLFGQSLKFLKCDFSEEERSSIISYSPDSWINSKKKIKIKSMIYKHQILHRSVEDQWLV